MPSTTVTSTVGSKSTSENEDRRTVLGVLKKWLASLIARLTTQHRSTGSDAMHMGNIAGGVQIKNTHVHNHFASAFRPKRVRPLGVDHAEVLSLMDPLPEAIRIKVLNFMRREFKTAMVIDLQANELIRLRAYVVKVRASIEGSR